VNENAEENKANNKPELFYTILLRGRAKETGFF
jgi:hypothetical protein